MRRMFAVLCDMQRTRIEEIMVQDSQSKEIFEASPLRDSRGQVNSAFDSKHFPIYGIHKKLDLSCTDCHLEENPKEYSIYDKYVANLLADYIKKYKDRDVFKEIIIRYNESAKDNFINCEKITKTSILASLKDYKTFISFIDAFINECNIKGKNVRAEVDNYLWLAGMREYRK